MTRHSVNNNTRMGLVIFLCPNLNHLISLIAPKLPRILDIYSVVVLQVANHFTFVQRIHTLRSSDQLLK